jgi:hypothetical protein
MGLDRVNKHLHFQRTVRTSHSERFVVSSGEVDLACFEVHYGADKVTGSLLVLDAAMNDDEIRGLIELFDELYLPDVSLDEGNLVFTVVRGSVVGTFENTPKDER